LITAEKPITASTKIKTRQNATENNQDMLEKRKIF
jgi:hypothetical protein